MKYLYIFFVIVCSYQLRSQCVTTMSFNVTAPTCSACCNGSATVSHSCAVAYTWAPGGGTGTFATNLCPGVYTVAAMMANTLCCGSSVGTATVFIPAAPPTSITELKDISSLTIFPGQNEISISSVGSSVFYTQITIKDLNAATVYDAPVTIGSDEIRIPLDVREGIYLVAVTDLTTQRRVIKKLFVQN
jgi:hypothetical protein